MDEQQADVWAAVTVTGQISSKRAMTDRPHNAAAAADFLQRALVGGVLDVTQLEAMARAAGLLGQRQQIQHAKAFKKGEKVPWHMIGSSRVWGYGKVGVVTAGESEKARKEGGGSYNGCAYLRASSFSICQFERLPRGAVERAHPSSLG